MNRTDRLVAILLELQARGELRASDLAEHFEVSIRTIYRDLDALSEGGVPLVAMPGKGYRLMEGYFLPPLQFTAAEAAALVLGGEFVRERVDSELRRAADDALGKLTALLPEKRRQEVARWRSELLFVGRSAQDERLGTIRQAIQARRVLRIEYWGYRRAGAEARVVEPYSLVYLNESWHLGAYCRSRQGSRIFKLERIQTIEPLAETFELGERHKRGPDWPERGADPGEARVRFEPEAARWARERNLYLFLREEDGAFVYAMRDEHTLLHWLLGWGSQVEVLEPESLRAQIAREADLVARKHADRMLSGAPR